MERFTRLTVAATLLIFLAGAIVLLPLAFMDAKSLRSAVERELFLRTGMQAHILGKIDISVFGGPSVSFGRVTLANKAGNVSADVTDMSVSIRYLSALAGLPAFSHIQMTGPRLTIVEPTGGKSLVDFERANLARQIADLDLESLSITNGRIVILKQPSGVDFIEAIDLEAGLRNDGRKISVSAEFTWRKTRFRSSVALDDLVGLLNGAQSGSSMKLQTQTDTATLDGALSLDPVPGLKGTISLGSSDIPKLLGWLVPDWSGDPVFKSLSVSGPGRVTPGGVSFETVNVQAFDMAGQGSLDLNWAKPRPRLQGTLAFEAISLPSGKPEVNPSASPLPDLSVLPLDILRRLDLDLRLSASYFTTAAVEAQDVGATLLSGRDRFSIEIGGANVLGGVGRIAFDIDGLTDLFAARLRASGKNIDISGLLVALGHDSGSQGRLTGDIDVQMRGVMPKPAFRSIEGLIDFTIETPQWQGGDIQAALQAGFERFASAPKPLPSLPSDFIRMRIKAEFDNKRLAVQESRMEAPGFAVDVRGIVEMAAQKLDLVGTAQFRDDGELPSQTDKPASLSVPIKITGTFAAPKVDFGTQPIKP